MIDVSILRAAGWSEELIEAAQKASAEMRYQQRSAGFDAELRISAERAREVAVGMLYGGAGHRSYPSPGSLRT